MIILQAAMFGYDRFWGKKKKDGEALEGPQAPPPILFTEAQVRTFTSEQQHGAVKFRVFDPDAARTIRADLAGRCAIPQALPPKIAAVATAFRVVSLREGAAVSAPTAAEVVRSAHEVGARVLGSLSLVLLMSGENAPFVILVGKDPALELAPLKDERGQPPTFALIPPEAAAKVEAPAPAPKRGRKKDVAASASVPPPSPPPAPAAAVPPDMKPPPIDTSRFERIPPAPPNGAGKAAPAVLGSVFGEPARKDGDA